MPPVSKSVRARPVCQGLCHRVLRPWLARMGTYSFAISTSEEIQYLIVLVKLQGFASLKSLTHLKVNKKVRTWLRIRCYYITYMYNISSMP